MSTHYEDESEGDDAFGLSRAEVETVCILHAIGTGCSLADLAERLGLPRELTSVVVEAMETLIANGDVVVEGTSVAVAATGCERLRARLDELGVPHASAT